MVVVPVPLITFLKLFKIFISSSGWPVSNIDIVNLYVSGVSDSGLYLIFTCGILDDLSSSLNFIFNGIGGYLKHVCTSAEIHFSYGFLHSRRIGCGFYVTYNNFENCHMPKIGHYKNKIRMMLNKLQKIGWFHYWLRIPLNSFKPLWIIFICTWKVVL